MILNIFYKGLIDNKCLLLGFECFIGQIDRGSEFDNVRVPDVSTKPHFLC